jgi:hypothetical protein
VTGVLQGLIERALNQTKGDERPIWISGDSLAAFGVNAATLGNALSRLHLYVAPNWDARGGALIARSPDILEQAERLKTRGQPVPIIVIAVEAPPGGRRRSRGAG